VTCVPPYDVIIVLFVGDRDSIVALSTSMGFLTGSESDEMLEAHIRSALVVGEPFSSDGIRTLNFSPLLCAFMLAFVSSLQLCCIEHDSSPPRSGIDHVAAAPHASSCRGVYTSSQGPFFPIVASVYILLI
jgi:hypothetical protein